MHVRRPRVAHAALPSSPTGIRRDGDVKIILWGDDIATDAYFPCDNCCKYTPDACPGNAWQPNPKDCEFLNILCSWESFSPFLDWRVHDFVNEVKGDLAAGIGVDPLYLVNGCLYCWLLANKCEAAHLNAFIEHIDGRMSEVKHTWRAYGVWASESPTCTCLTAGAGWTVPESSCATGRSIAIGNVYVIAKCGDPISDECPEREPCH